MPPPPCHPADHLHPTDRLHLSPSLITELSPPSFYSRWRNHAVGRLSCHDACVCRPALLNTTSHYKATFSKFSEPVWATVGSGGTTDMLSLLAGDKTIDLALFVDNTFTEAFWMNGRVAMTVDTKTSGGQDDVTISASQAGVTASATVWQVGSIWVDPEVVKQTPRRDSSLVGAVVED